MQGPVPRIAAGNADIRADLYSVLPCKILPLSTALSLRAKAWLHPLLLRSCYHSPLPCIAVDETEPAAKSQWASQRLVTLPNPSPGVYRDDPDRDDTASTSSAVLMDDIDYLDSRPPTYEDVLALIETYTGTSPRASVVRGVPVPVGVLALCCASTEYAY